MKAKCRFRIATALFLFYVLQKRNYKFTYFSKIYYYIKLNDHTLSALDVTLISELRTAAMLVLLMVKY
jgi:hypothetical protein